MIKPFYDQLVLHKSRGKYLKFMSYGQWFRFLYVRNIKPSDIHLRICEDYRENESDSMEDEYDLSMKAVQMFMKNNVLSDCDETTSYEF